MHGAQSLLDSFTIPGYNVPDAIPEALTAEAQPITEYKIPPAVWMVLFLVAGYVGLRLVLED